MCLLKNVPGLLPSLESSPITMTTMWEKDVSSLVPQQLFAFRNLQSFNPNIAIEIIDTQLEFLVHHVRLAEQSGIIDCSPISNYKSPRNRAIRSTRFVKGLSMINQCERLAIIYGLEMDLSIDRLINLTLSKLEQAPIKSPLALQALRAQPISMLTSLVFWRADDKQHLPHTYLNVVVNAAFDMGWNDLRKAYQMMIPDHYEDIVSYTIQ